MTITRSIGICAAIAAFAAYQASKAFVLASAEVLADGIAVFLGDSLIFHHNTGVTFELLQSAPGWALALIATAIVLFLVISLMRSLGTVEAVICGLVIGGALGNIVDRSRFGGVTDFLDFYIGITHWPAFNLADVFVVFGLGLLLIVAGRERAISKETSQ